MISVVLIELVDSELSQDYFGERQTSRQNACTCMDVVFALYNQSRVGLLFGAHCSH